MPSCTDILSGSYTYDADRIPRNIRATGQTQTSLSLAWDSPVKSVVGYQVYRAFDYTQEFKPIGTTAIPSYTDSTVETSRLYFYRVTSLYSGVN